MKFSAVEHVLPSLQVSNDEVIERLRDASARYLAPPELDAIEAWTRACFDSAGTRVRYHLAPGEQPCELATRAGRAALAAAQLEPNDIGLLIYVGIGRGVLEPASATTFQDMLALRRATAFDVQDACASWTRALGIARLYIESKQHRHVMILNAEFMGRLGYRYELRSIDEFAHWHPGVTIGEAASACIVSASEADDAFAADFRTYGERRDLCFVPMANADGYFGKQVTPSMGSQSIQLFSYGARLLEFTATKLVEHYRATPAFRAFDADVIFSHAASDGMSERVLAECQLPVGRHVFAHASCANTVSASVPVAMSMALESGRLKAGHRVLVLMGSAGVTTGLVKFVFLQ